MIVVIEKLDCFFHINVQKVLFQSLRTQIEVDGESCS